MNVKVIVRTSAAVMLCGLLGFFVYQWFGCRQGIDNYKHPQDYAAFMDILKADWQWLVSEDSVDFNADYTLTHHARDHRYPDNSLTIKVYRQCGVPVGFVTYYKPSAMLGRVQFLAVGKEYRRHGFAKKLLEYAVGQLKKMGCTRAELVTRTTNIGAQRLYKKVGFKQVWEYDDYVGFEIPLT